MFRSKLFLVVLFCLWSVSYCVADDKCNYQYKKIEQLAQKTKANILKFGSFQSNKNITIKTNEKQFQNDDIYLCLLDYEGNCHAALRRELIGLNMFDVKDPNGFPLIQNMIGIASSTKNEGGWVEYLWFNPKSNKFENESAFCLSVDGKYWIYAGIQKCSNIKH